MTTVRNAALEDLAGRLEELQSEIDSYADELAEVKQENEYLKVELLRLMADRSMAV